MNNSECLFKFSNQLCLCSANSEGAAAHAEFPLVEITDNNTANWESNGTDATAIDLVLLQPVQNLSQTSTSTAATTTTGTLVPTRGISKKVNETLSEIEDDGLPGKVNSSPEIVASDPNFMKTIDDGIETLASESSIIFQLIDSLVEQKQRLGSSPLDSNHSAHTSTTKSKTTGSDERLGAAHDKPVAAEANVELDDFDGETPSNTGQSTTVVTETIGEVFWFDAEDNNTTIIAREDGTGSLLPERREQTSTAAPTTTGTIPSLEQNTSRFNNEPESTKVSVVTGPTFFFNSENNNSDLSNNTIGTANKAASDSGNTDVTTVVDSSLVTGTTFFFNPEDSRKISGNQILLSSVTNADDRTPDGETTAIASAFTTSPTLVVNSTDSPPQAGSGTNQAQVRRNSQDPANGTAGEAHKKSDKTSINIAKEDDEVNDGTLVELIRTTTDTLAENFTEIPSIYGDNNDLELTTEVSIIKFSEEVANKTSRLAQNSGLALDVFVETSTQSLTNTTSSIPKIRNDTVIVDNIPNGELSKSSLPTSNNSNNQNTTQTATDSSSADMATESVPDLPLEVTSTPSEANSTPETVTTTNNGNENLSTSVLTLGNSSNTKTTTQNATSSSPVVTT